MSFEARLRRNLFYLWLFGVGINTSILLWIGEGKISLTSLIAIALGLAAVNLIVAVVIYFVLRTVYAKQTDSASIKKK